MNFSQTSQINSKIVPPDTMYQSYLNNPQENSFFLSPTTKNGIQGYISTMKTDKASGPRILKDFKEHILKPLSDILNTSLSAVAFQLYFKCAQFIPIFKNGDKLQSNNYKAISLLSNTSKIIEKIFHY